jgi:hypothetical protein
LHRPAPKGAGFHFIAGYGDDDFVFQELV